MSTPLELFEKHCAIAKCAGFVFTSNLPVGSKELMVCFDDGFRGIWDCKDRIASLGIRPTIFIAPGLIGKNGYLNWWEIKELQDMGFVFQSHTYSHQRLTEVAESELLHELRDARDYLSEKVGREVTQLCFPQGRFNEHVCNLALEYGYELLYSSIPGDSSRRIFPSMVCRNLVQFATPRIYMAILNGGMDRLWKRYYKQHHVG